MKSTPKLRCLEGHISQLVPIPTAAPALGEMLSTDPTAPSAFTNPHLEEATIR